jgi:hypothetical protein
MLDLRNICSGLKEIIGERDYERYGELTPANSKWVDISRKISEVVVEQESYVIGNLIPGLRLLQAFQVEDSLSKYGCNVAWSVRATNCLKRIPSTRPGPINWAELANKTIGDLFQVTNVGRTTVMEFVEGAVTVAAYVDEILGGKIVHEQTEVAPEEKLNLPTAELFDTARNIGLVRRWASEVLGKGDLDSAIKEFQIRNVPIEIANALTQIMLTRNDEQILNLGEGIEQIFGQLSDVERQILTARRLVDSPVNLRELGHRTNLSGERIRQLVPKIEGRLRAVLLEDQFQSLRWKIEFLRQQWGAVVPMEAPDLDEAVKTRIAESVLSESEYLRLLSWLVTGSYPIDGWILQTDLQELIDVITGAANEYGIIETNLEQLLIDRNVRHDLVNLVLNKIPNLGTILNRWVVVKAKHADRASQLLAILERPSSGEELFNYLDISGNIRGFINAIQADERIVRITKDKYALSDWGESSYVGICDAIEKQLEGHSSPMEMEHLASIISEKYEVSKSSVRAYCSAPIFVIEKGFVRRRGEQEGFDFNDDVSNLDWVAVKGREVRISFAVNSELLRGSGRGIPINLSWRLGLTPGDNKLLTGEFGPISFAWNKRSFSGGQIGSLQLAARHMGCEEGDSLVMTIDKNALTYFFEAE